MYYCKDCNIISKSNFPPWECERSHRNAVYLGTVPSETCDEHLGKYYAVPGIIDLLPKTPAEIVEILLLIERERINGNTVNLYSITTQVRE